MRSRKPDPTSQSDMFRESLEAILDPQHELLRLAARIDWDRLDALDGATFVEHVGRPGLPTGLMVGLHLLKHIKGLSDEAVCAAWVENPYFQAFCGETHFQHRLPADRSSMTNWRKRMDDDKLEALLAETVSIAMASGAVSERQLERVTVDTTVQTKREIVSGSFGGYFMPVIAVIIIGAFLLVVVVEMQMGCTQVRVYDAETMEDRLECDYTPRLLR